MRFDYTHGEKAKYVVSIYGWNVEDKYYFADLEKAKGLFQSIMNKHNLEEGTSVTLYNVYE